MAQTRADDDYVVIRNFFEEKRIKILELTTNLSDLNAIENIWSTL